MVKYNSFLQKRIPSDFFRYLGAVFDRFFKTALYVSRGTVWQNLNFPRNFFLFFSRFWREVWTFGEMFYDLWWQRFRYFWQNCFLFVQKRTVGFQSCFGIMNECRLNFGGNGKQWVGRPILPGWFSFNNSRWQKLRKQLPSNSNFWKDMFQLEECIKNLEMPLFRQFFMFFRN